jgi:hypothetical protein
MNNTVKNSEETQKQATKLDFVRVRQYCHVTSACLLADVTISHVTCHMASHRKHSGFRSKKCKLKQEKAVDRGWFKQLDATKDAVCLKSSDKEAPKAAPSHHLQIRSPINLFIDRREEVNSTAKVTVLLHRGAPFRNFIERSVSDFRLII